MNDLIEPDMDIGALALALAVAIFYAVCHVYKESNHRDAGLLAAEGTVSLMGSALA